jgi:hypothetical protein
VFVIVQSGLQVEEVHKTKEPTQTHNDNKRSPKMSIPNEKLQQLLQEIQSKAQFAEQQLVLVRQQMQSQTRKKRMLELSTAEIDALPQETRVYNGVGKM